MDIVLTLVVNPEHSDLLEKAQGVISRTINSSPDQTNVLHDGRALDLLFSAPSIDAMRGQIADVMQSFPAVDWCLQEHTASRRKALLIADMDSTMITVECIDELADFVGAKDRVSVITEAAMRGELDFEGALKERVALLKGMPLEKLKTCYRERIEIMAGAKTLVKTMVSAGAYAALVSGGFTFFTERVAREIGFRDHRANTLESKDGKLTGTVAEPICGAAAKLDALNDYRHELKLSPDQILAVGDGANDIPMLQAAGLGVAYHAKPKTAAASHAAINNGDLTALLYFQGYRASDFEDG